MIFEGSGFLSLLIVASFLAMPLLLGLVAKSNNLSFILWFLVGLVPVANFVGFLILLFYPEKDDVYG